MLIVFFTISKRNHSAAIWWLSLGSFFFYGSWNPTYLPLLICSIVVNFCVGKFIESGNKKRFTLVFGLVFNLGLLGYFKYTNFFINNINLTLGTQFQVEPIVLPLAISFFTFQQIVWIIDKYRGDTLKSNVREYIGAVTFFPHLIAGPIVQYKHLIPQFENHSKVRPNWENLSQGLFLISVGAFKKLVIADTLSIYVGNGFDGGTELSLFFAWMSVLAYTFQIYFDFSGYCDIAIGSAWLFNIRLPDNFHSPYKSSNIKEFWQRWHITLGYFLTNYLYIPLGGNRKGKYRTYINILIVMFLSGLWHGAAYGFILWGLAHGLAMVLQRIFSGITQYIPRIISIVITFLFINLSWVLFRAETLGSAINLYKGMFGQHGIELSKKFQHILPQSWNITYARTADSALFANGSPSELIGMLIFSFCIVFLGREALFFWKKIPSKSNAYALAICLMAGVIFTLALFKSLVVPHTEFIYFNF